MPEPLEFTGERFTPECVREIWYEHWHRYAFALGFAHGRRVVDAACGEGYGAALLASVAAEVIGIDRAPEVIAHARARYGGRPNLRFEQGDATALALPAASADLVVSFETLEHVAHQDALLAGFARVLAPGGLLLISTPDRRTYSDLAGFRNEHHVRELYRDEFEALLGRHFGAVRLFGQKLLFQSAIWSLDGAPERVAAMTAGGDGGAPSTGLGYAPLYLVALCARDANELPPDLERRLSLFGDAAESVYAHYNDEVRKHIRAGTLLAEAERRAAAAEARAAAAEARLADAPCAPQHEAAGADSPPGWLARLRRRLGV